MARDRISMNILSVLKESAENNKETLVEMPQRLKIRKKVTGYDYKDLSQGQRERLSGSRYGSDNDAKERFRQDAILDLTNRFNNVVPDTFTPKYGSPVGLKEDNDRDSIYVDVKPKNLANFVASKFSELEIIPDAHSYTEDFSVSFNGEDPWNNKTSAMRKILSSLTNFDDLRRQSKVAINDFLGEIYDGLVKAIQEHIVEFKKARSNYDKYTNLSAKEKEDELSKNWYDKYGNVIRAKNLDESFIKECSLTEAKDIEIEDYLEIYDFDELSDYAKDKIANRKVRLQIQKMFDRMTEILETDFTEYMSQRGLELEPGQFDIESLLYNMTHENTGRWGSSSMTRFYITKSELASYIRNNEDLVEKYGQKELDRLMAFMTTDRGDSQPVYTIYYGGDKNIKFSDNFNFKHYNYDTHKDEYYDGADEKLMKLYADLEHELSLDFYSSYKLLDKAMKQLREEAKQIVYAKIAKSKDKYLYNGEKFDRSKYNIIEDEPEENKEEK